MLRKCSKLLAVFTAAALVITTFGSDFSNAKAWAAEDETVEAIQSEGSSDGIVTADWEKVPESEDTNNQSTEESSQNEDSEQAQDGDSQQAQDGDSQQAQDEAAATENSDESGAENTAADGEDAIGTEEGANGEGVDAATDAASEDITSDETDADAASLEASEEDAKELSESAKEKDAEEKENVEYPAQSFDGSVSGMNVSVEAEEGAFPKGTEMKLSAISDGEAISAAENALDGEVKAAKGVDISFADAEGKEIEPKGAVNVSITLADALEGEDFSVVHLDNNGNAEKVASASEDGASFTADSFSVYIVAGSGDSGDDHEDQKAIATYNFYVNDTLFDTQLIKKGDILQSPGVPSVDTDKNEVFLGWFEKKDDGTLADDPVELDVPKDHVEADKTYNIYAKIETTYYLTFIGLGGEIFHVMKVVVNTGDSTTVNIENVGIDPERRYETAENKRFIGWAENAGISAVSNSDPRILKEVDVAVTDTVYAVECSYVWISFDENTGNSYSGTSYTQPIMATYDSAASQPADPTRPQYIFNGWYKDKETTVPYDWNTVIGSTEETQKDFTLYAKWVEKEDTTYTIVVWQQNLDGSSFDYYNTYNNVKGKTNAVVDDALLGKYLELDKSEKNLKHFEYDASRKEYEVGTTKTGSFVPYGEGEKKLSVDEDTIVNIYYCRRVMTIEFYESDKSSFITSISGLYEQPVENWPEDEVVWQFYRKGDSKPWDIDFIERYILDEYLDDESGTTLKLYKCVGAKESKAVFHFMKQTLDGDYEQERELVHYAGLNAKDPSIGKKYKVMVEDYYLGFYPSFANKTGDPEDNSNKITVNTLIEGVTKPVDSEEKEEVYLYFDRVTRTLSFKDYFMGKQSNIPADEKYDAILFEMPLSGYKEGAPEASALDDKKAARAGYELETDENGNIKWFVDQQGQVEYNWDDEMPLYNKVLYTHWKPVTRHVTLIANGGTIRGDDEFDVPYGDKLDRSYFNSPDAATGKVYRDNYEFVGWYYENNTPYEFGAITEDVILYAHWRNPGRIDVVYDAAPHGSGEPTDDYNYAMKSSVVVGAPPTTVEKGYVFIGWVIDKDSKNVIYYPDNCFEIASDEYIQVIDGVNTIVIKALYNKVNEDDSKNEYTTITYHSNFGTDLTVTVAAGADGKLKVNETVTALSNTDCGFTRPGYRFVGWSKVSGENNYPVFVNPGDKIAADNDGVPNPIDIGKNNHLYAIWEFIPDTPPGPPPTDPPTPPGPPPTDPPTPPGPPTDPPTTPIPPTTPSVAGQAVLGERRPLVEGDGRAVLGARRSRTEDTTDVAGRVVIIILAGIAATGALMLGKKKEEEN